MEIRPSSTVAVALLLVSAGCLGSFTGGSGTPSETPAEGQLPPTPSNDTREESPGVPLNTPFSNASIGEPSDPPDSNEEHQYLLWNNRSSERTIAITVWRNSTVAFERSVDFPADGVYRIDVYRPGNYTLAIEPSGSDRHVIDTPDTFDCNYRVVEAAIQPDGSVSFHSYQSLEYCGTPS